MRLPTLSLMTTLVLAGAATEAAAQVTSLLTLSNLRQSVDLSYRFDANQGTLDSTFQQGLQEDYRLSIDYSVYRARLLHGQIALDLQANQEKFSGQGKSSGISKGYGLLYDINGVLLDRFPYPVNFFFSSNITQIPREFASSYQQTNDSSGVSVTLNSRYLPVAFNYTRSSNETSGLESDRIQISDTFSFGASHNYGEKSQTQFTIFNTNQSGAFKGGGTIDKTGNLEATLNNTYMLGTKELNRVLYSRWRIGNQRGANESRYAELGEYLAWDFGKALTSGLDYTFSKRDTLENSQLLNSSRLWLQHRLFKSLTTRFDLMGTHNSLNTGTEQNASGTVSVAYQKLLPAQSLFHLQGHKQYGVSSNELTEDRLAVLDEPHTASLVDQLLLIEPEVVPGSIVVRNADPAVRALPYVENRDYQVRQIGRLTEIFVRVAGSEIQAGDRLLISYQHFVNTQITYSYSSQGVGGDVILFDNKYRIFASYDTSRQDLISGEESQVNLIGSESYFLGFEKRYQAGSFTAEYDNTTSDVDSNQSVSGYLVYGGDYRQGKVSFTASDRYVLVETNPLVNTSATRRSVNIFSAGGSYSKALENSAVITASASFMDSRGTIASENLNLGLGVTWNLRRMVISVLSQANFRYTSGNLTSDEHIQLRLSRYF